MDWESVHPHQLRAACPGLAAEFERLMRTAPCAPDDAATRYVLRMRSSNPHDLYVHAGPFTPCRVERYSLGLLGRNIGGCGAAVKRRGSTQWEHLLTAGQTAVMVRVRDFMRRWVQGGGDEEEEEERGDNGGLRQVLAAALARLAELEIRVGATEGAGARLPPQPVLL